MSRIRAVSRSLFTLGMLVGLTGAVLGQSTEYAITHITLINPGSDKSEPDQTIVISGDTIKGVVSSTRFTPSSSIRLIDGRGKFVIPGLWDMHVHFRDPRRDLEMDIANGVLGIRDMGDVAQDRFSLRNAMAQGQQAGPKIVACGPMKLRNFGSPSLPSAISVHEASNAGQRSLEHGIALAGGSTVEAAYIERRLDQSAFQEAMRTKNFSLIPAKIAHDETLMLDHFIQPLVDKTYSLLATNGTFITPTLVTQRALTFVDDLNKENDPRMQYVSAEELNWWKPENGMLTKYRTREYIAMRKREYDLLLKEVHRAQTMGVRLLAGTDITIPFTYPGFSLHDELALFVKAGLTPSQALETAATNPALLLGLSTKWGRVSSGYVANFVLLNADPLLDIGNTKKIHGVVRNGEFLDRTRLDQMLHDAQVTGQSRTSTSR
ncbi:MAG TPA: amidohydrolase family protein [Candidatus Sulfotelmatobacter sp.]|nr:amidohydrolase family protein [Candidatus Sulfotelmatobacter sp.]